MECLSYCVANTFDLSRLDNYFKLNMHGYSSTKSRDVLKITSLSGQRYILFIFKNGTMVAWGLKRHRITPYLNLIKQFASQPLAFLVHDEFSYQLSDKISIEPHDYFDVDCITLDDDSDELKLALSYGFSQSVKLQYFERTLENLIDKYSPLIRLLSDKGNIPISRTQIRKIIGEILHAKSEMNLISNFLYHPKYFWQHPTLEHVVLNDNMNLLKNQKLLVATCGYMMYMQLHPVFLFLKYKVCF